MELKMYVEQDILEVMTFANSIEEATEKIFKYAKEDFEDDGIVEDLKMEMIDGNHFSIDYYNTETNEQESGVLEIKEVNPFYDVVDIQELCFFDKKIE